MGRWTGCTVWAGLLVLSGFCIFFAVGEGLGEECQQDSWFGQNCGYRCQCEFWNFCIDHPADCFYHCGKGFAGRACQYVKLKTGAVCSSQDIVGECEHLADGDKNTCIYEDKDGHGNKPLSVTLSNSGSWATAVHVFLGRDASKYAGAEDLEVRVYNSSTSILQPIPTEQNVIYLLPQPTWVTNIQIQNLGNKSLHLCELSLLGGWNLALKKPTRLGNTINSEGRIVTATDILVDGHLSQADVFHLGVSSNSSAWSVNLGENLYIWSLRIYSNYDNGTDGLAGLRVNVTKENNDVTEVYRHRMGSPIGNFSEIILPKPIPASYVTLWHENESTALVLNEVQVYGDCMNGFHGWKCDQRCSCDGRKSSVCDKISGSCLHPECRAGYSGSNCEKCQEGKYGISCSEQCSSACSKNTCNHVTGECPTVTTSAAGTVSSSAGNASDMLTKDTFGLPSIPTTDIWDRGNGVSGSGLGVNDTGMPVTAEKVTDANADKDRTMIRDDDNDDDGSQAAVGVVLGLLAVLGAAVIVYIVLRQRKTREQNRQSDLEAQDDFGHGGFYRPRSNDNQQLSNLNHSENHSAVGNGQQDHERASSVLENPGKQQEQENKEKAEEENAEGKLQGNHETRSSSSTSSVEQEEENQAMEQQYGKKHDSGSDDDEDKDEKLEKEESKAQEVQQNGVVTGQQGLGLEGEGEQTAGKDGGEQDGGGVEATSEKVETVEPNTDQEITAEQKTEEDDDDTEEDEEGDEYEEDD